MMSAAHIGLPPPLRAGIITVLVKSVVAVVIFLLAASALAQQQPEAKGDDLDVTMQIIVDPDAKLPDEVVRRIPLPARKPGDQSEQNAGDKRTQPDAAAQGQERAREAKELGREMGASAKERAREAAEQREEARRAAAEERRRNNPPGPPADPPGRPPRP